jgi:hypothetical protein
MFAEPGAFRVRPLPRPGQQIDRRTQRSDSAADALRMALTNAARRGALEAVLLVDDDGMLVAQSDTDLELELLAAVTPIVGRGKDIPRVRRGDTMLHLSVCPVEMHDELLYLAVLGGTPLTRRRELAGSVAAARRILA